MIESSKAKLSFFESINTQANLDGRESLLRPSVTVINVTNSCKLSPCTFIKPASTTGLRLSRPSSTFLLESPAAQPHHILYCDYISDAMRFVVLPPYQTPRSPPTQITYSIVAVAPHMTAFTSSVSSVCRWPVVTARRERMLNVSSTCTNTPAVSDS